MAFSEQLPIITSADGQLFLAPYTLEDAQDIFGLIDRNREHLSQFDDDTARKYPTLDSVIASISNPVNFGRHRLGIRESSGVLVGAINLTRTVRSRRTAEIGYYVGSEFGGRGIGTNAVQTLSAYSFAHLGFSSLYGDVVEQNLISQRVLQKAGYKKTNQYRAHDFTYVRLTRFA